jgi:hypothetical protein
MRRPASCWRKMCDAVRGLRGESVRLPRDSATKVLSAGVLPVSRWTKPPCTKVAVIGGGRALPSRRLLHECGAMSNYCSCGRVEWIGSALAVHFSPPEQPHACLMSAGLHQPAVARRTSIGLPRWLRGSWRGKSVRVKRSRVAKTAHARCKSFCGLAVARRPPTQTPRT